MRTSKSKDGQRSVSLLWITWCAYFIIVYYLGFHHEHWLDEWHVWSMCKQLSISQLWDAMTEEGHFCLWHLLILPFARLGCGLWSLNLVSGTLGIAAGWLVLFKSPFNYFCKVLLLLSFPLLYSFSVLPRCYSLIPCICFAIAVFYRFLPKHKYLFCFFVGLLAHTHSYMEGFVGALFLLYCYEYLYLPAKKRRPWKQNIGPALLTIGLVILAYLQVMHSLDYSQEHLGNKKDSNIEVVDKIFSDYSILPSQVISQQLETTMPCNLDLAITLFVWIFAGYALYKCFCEQKSSRYLAIVGYISIVFILTFATNIFYIMHQRIYLPFIIIVTLLWFNAEKKIQKYTSYAIICLVLLTSFNRYYIIYHDATGLYSNGELVANYIKQTIPKGSIIAMNNRYKFINELLDEDYQHYSIGNDDNLITDSEIDEFFDKHQPDFFFPMFLGYFEPENPIYIGEKYRFDCLHDATEDNALFYHFSLYKIQKKQQPPL